MNMSEILSFEEFVSKRNEARAVIKDYVIDCYIKKVKEKLLEKNPGISQRQLKMKTRQARDSFKDSAKCRELMEAVPLENVSKSLAKKCSYIYVSESKNGKQYLDSLGGNCESGGYYVRGNFFFAS